MGEALVGALGLVIVLGAVVLVLRTLMGTYRRFAGARVVTCPETSQTAAVRVDAWHAAAMAVLVRPDLRLSGCSRWPEHRRCGQVCLDEIESAPDEGVLLRKLRAWYHGKSCALCGWPLADIPALLGPDQRILEWTDVPAPRLLELLSTHRPVCWKCHVVEDLHREHPELVVKGRRPSADLRGH